MSVTLTSTMPGATSDYQKYIWTENNAPTKSTSKDSSILFDFSMVPYDSNFIQLTRGAYITVNTSTYTKWFTGFITSDPEYVYLGTKSGTAVWGYKYRATSDDYILNLSTVGIQPTFIGQTMGQVIISLVNQLCPGVFDTSNVQSGLNLASYYITPDKRFKDIVKDFTDTANYYFYAQDKKLYFAPQSLSSSTLTLDMSNKDFTPSNLTIRPSLNQIVNDAIVVGDIAPQAYVDEYIVGDGFTGEFPLLSSVYGADRYILLNENFQGSSISSQNWTVVDQPANYLQLYNGYLNVLGGDSSNSYNVYLKSLYPIALEGVTRFTHGEFDFLPQVLTSTTTGVIGGLWTVNPNSSFSGCIFGIECFYNGGGTFGVRPIVNGVSQTSMFQLPDTSGAKRYIFRTIMTCNKLHRRIQGHNYRDINGVIQQLLDGDNGDTAFFQTYVSEIDVTTGLLTNSWKWENDNVTLSSSTLFASYIPVVSNNATLTVSGITVSVPLLASLDKSILVAMDNNDFDDWTNATSPASWTFFVSANQETSTVVSGSACKLIATDTASGDPVAGLTRPISKDLTPGVTYVMSICVQKSSNFTVGNLTVDISNAAGTVFGTQIITSYTDISSTDFTQITGTLTTGFTQTDLNSGLFLRVYMGDQSTTGITGYAVATSYLIIDDLIIRQDWEALSIGPNDLDNLQGDTTVATIVSNNNTPQTTTQTGSPTYYPGASSLVFFKDTVLQTSTQPQPNELYRLTYRASGNCYGRAVDKTSIASEAGLWGDSGIRSVIKTDTKPRPRNVRECQLAAAAMVGQDGYQHFEGSYQQLSNYMSQEPIPGTLIQFINKPTGFANIITEEINSVSSVLISTRPVERFNITVNFGEPTYVKKTVAKFAQPQGSYLEYAQGQESITQVVDLGSVLATTNSVAPVVNPILTNWDSTSFTVDPNQSAPSGGGFEVRTSDYGWGCEDGNNLLTRATGKFTISRQDKPLAVFIKPYDIRNYLTYSELYNPTTSSLASNYTRTGVTVSFSKMQGPNNRLANIATAVMTSGGTLLASSANITVAAGDGVSGSVYINAHSDAIGKQMVITLYNSATLIATLSIILTSGWQRYTISASISAGTTRPFKVQLWNRSTGSYSVDVTQFSIEKNINETIYCKTLATTYGAVSTYPAAVKISFPPVNGPIGAYADSTLTVDTLNSNFFVSPPSQVETIDDTFVIVADALIKSITSTDDITINTVPVINNGVNGQYLTIINVGTHTITLPCSTTLSGSTIATPTDVVLTPNGLYDFVFLSGIGWVQSSGSGSNYGTSGYSGISRYF